MDDEWWQIIRLEDRQFLDWVPRDSLIDRWMHKRSPIFWQQFDDGEKFQNEMQTITFGFDNSLRFDPLSHLTAFVPQHCLHSLHVPDTIENNWFRFERLWKTTVQTQVKYLFFKLWWHCTSKNIIMLTTGILSLNVHDSLTFDGTEICLNPDLFSPTEHAGGGGSSQKANVVGIGTSSIGSGNSVGTSNVSSTGLSVGDTIEIRVWDPLPPGTPPCVSKSAW